MALLLRDRDATSEVAATPPGDGAPVIVPDFACETCGAAMLAGQDWCLECGTAAPGRLGARPGWRAGFTVVALTLLLVVGAVVASYAALTTDAERRAAAPSTGDGTPIAAPGPAAVQPAAPGAPIAPGATGPGTVPPAGTTGPAGTVPPPIIPTQPTNPTNPSTGSTPGGPIGPLTPPTGTPPSGSSPAGTPPPTVTPPAGDTPPPPPAGPTAEIVKFDKDSATTYDPGKRAGAEFGPPRYAVDAKEKTVWDVVVPVDGKPIGAGLLLDLGKPYALRAIEIATPTEGFHVELYAAVSNKETPEDILDKRWEHLTDIKGVTDGKVVSLLKKSKNKQRLLLLYITQPGEPTDPRAAIGNVKVAGTP